MVTGSGGQASLYRAFVEATDDLVMQVDHEGKILYVNGTAKRVFGLPVDECLGLSAFDFVHPEDRVTSKEVFHDWFVGERSTSTHENRQVSRSGEVRTMVWSASALRGEEGAATSLVATAKDITALRASERDRAALTDDLRQTSALLETLFDAIPDVIGLQDTRHRVIRYNEAGYRFLGKSQVEVEGRRCWELIGRARPCEVCATSEAYETKRPARVERFVEEVGLHLDVRAYPVLDESGEVVRVVEHMRDVTEERGLEERLRHMERMETVGQLAGGVAHDFNNLLSPVLGYTDLIIDGLSPDDPRRAQLEIVMEAAERARDLTRQLLAFGRKQVLEVTNLDVADLVTSFERMMRRAIREDVDIVITMSKGPGGVRGDALQLQRVLMNLALNAQDAMPEGGTLTLDVSDVEIATEGSWVPSGVAPGRYVQLTVSDTGQGMDEHTLAHAFEPFFTTKEVGEGTGLGLSTAYGIVGQHGGTIRIETQPGGGAAFKILLPRASGEPSDPPAKTDAAQDAPILEATIAVVEDDELVRQLAARLLRRLGYEVLVSEGPEEFLKTLEEGSREVDLLLSDVVMPKMDGRQLFTAAQRLRPSLKVLYMSGYPRDVVAQRGALDEGTVLLPKPFSLENLAEKIRQVLSD